MSAFAFPLYVVSHLLVTVWAIRLARVDKAPGAWIVAFIAGALVYDNLIVSLGAAIGIGPTLEILSYPRFLLHAMGTPFMLVAATQIGAAGGIRWCESKTWQWVMWILVVGTMAEGFFAHVVGLEIFPACFDGIVRYTANLSPSHFCFEGQEAVRGAGPPIPAIVGNIVAAVVGFFLWRNNGWGWLLVGALIMFAAAAIPMSVYGMAPGNGGEAILMWAYVASVARFGRFRKSGVETEAG